MKDSRRVVGLDTLRFLSAIVVVMCHFSIPPIFQSVGLDVTEGIGRKLQNTYGLVFYARAAVIVFFVISGFCIHYPYRNGGKPVLTGYYLRRYIRILFPWLAAYGIALSIGMDYSKYHDAVLWSLAAELVYYTIYPLLLAIRRQVGGWVAILAVLFPLSFLVTLRDTSIIYYFEHGVAWTWLVGLPCWTLGCLLAETYDFSMNVDGRAITRWRLGVWAASSACLTLHCHTPLRNEIILLNCFTILAYFWLKREIAYSAKHPPSPMLEKLGVWTFSVYVFHVPLIRMLKNFTALSGFNPMIEWIVKFTVILACSYVFYLLVEKPSHELARRFKNLEDGSRQRTKEQAVLASAPVAGPGMLESAGFDR